MFFDCEIPAGTVFHADIPYTCWNRGDERELPSYADAGGSGGEGPEWSPSGLSMPATAIALLAATMIILSISL